MWLEVFTVPFVDSCSKTQDSEEWSCVVITAASVTEEISGAQVTCQGAHGSESPAFGILNTPAHSLNLTQGEPSGLPLDSVRKERWVYAGIIHLAVLHLVSCMPFKKKESTCGL